MNIIDKIYGCKGGTIHTFETERTLVLAKKLGDHTLVKKSVYQAQIGVGYENTKKGKERIENGEEIGSLKGSQHWFDERRILIINENTNELSVRLNLVKNGNHHTTYVWDGEETTIDQLLAIGVSKSVLGLTGDSSNTTIQVKIKNIVDIR